MQAISFYSALKQRASCETTLDSLSCCRLYLSPSPPVIILQPLLGLPLSALSLGGFQLRTTFSMAEEFLLSLFPVHFHFCSLTCIATDFSRAHHLISSFEVTSYQKVFKIFLRYLFIQGVPGGMCQTSGECSLC